MDAKNGGPEKGAMTCSHHPHESVREGVRNPPHQPANCVAGGQDVLAGLCFVQTMKIQIILRLWNVEQWSPVTDVCR